MTNQIEIVSGLPADFTSSERTKFQELVAHAGEVIGGAMTANIADARALVMLKRGGIVRGGAALKRPRGSYREKIMKQAAAALLESDYPYELGYVFVEPSLQGCGLSHLLVSEALAHSDGAAVFATARTDNDAMRATLCKAGFVAMGRPYPGQQGRSIGLLLKAEDMPGHS